MDSLHFLLRTSVYMLAFIVCYYAMSCIQFEKMIKANHVSQARVFYFLLVMGLAYLTGSFVMVFFRF